MSAVATCASCNHAVPTTSAFCEQCGERVGGEDAAIAALYAPALKRARTWILAVGILYAATALLFVAIGDFRAPERNLVLGINFGLLAIHVGLWWWAKQAPFAAAVVALALFVTLHTVEAILDPSTIAQGIIIKVLFLVVLIQAVKAGLEVRRLMTEAPVTS